ncbi:ABC transporter substrate-binding protein [Streptosporangium roseum]|uniref:Extracellular solute-binding protein family 3 n=1 Tax=Streptosporangium roseum (strain ATCC 12428 / DSM 43021 / JCM 3005 / KCTC 9067 / NCIMB 10171 / NRRL 2505 / NI 9100) TaxID=479432 RepID=D2BFH2_STRRD|nr:ABC transporter substrate-binding protein [Streptosporangium roseum]ACZ88330.1 extracellular solute-binding protein family 3 [Streptosporangium roseum DSM 43021]
MTKRLYSVIAVALAVSAFAGGCGRSSSGTDAGAGAASAAGKTAKDLVPEAVRKTGELRMATSEGYPPMEMYKPGTQELTGVDPDLAAAIAAKLGLKVKVTNAAFDGLIPGLQAGRWDMVMSSMSDTEERRAAVDFVDYFSAGGAIMVKKGNPEGIKTLEDLCGRTVVLAKGSSNLAIGQRQDEKCAKKMQIMQSEDAPTGLLSIDSGRAVATIVDSPVAAMYAKDTGKYDVLPEQYDAGPWGIAVDRRNTALRDAVAKAMQELTADGGYKAVLEKYGVASNAVPEVMVNTKPWK